MNILKRNRTDLKLSHSEAHKLTEAFMMGDTTLAQEQMLYAYYRSDSISPELEEYRPMMVTLGDASSKSASPRKSKLLWVKIASVAASIAIVSTLLFSYFSSIQTQREYDSFAEIYGTSYVIRNGKRITDPQEVKRHVHNAELYASLHEEAIDQAINAAEQALADKMEELYPDPETRELIEEFIN